MSDKPRGLIGAVWTSMEQEKGDLVERSDFPIGDRLNGEVSRLSEKIPGAIARVISSAENFPEVAHEALQEIHKKNETLSTPVLGITGTLMVVD